MHYVGSGSRVRLLSYGRSSPGGRAGGGAGYYVRYVRIDDEGGQGFVSTSVIPEGLRLYVARILGDFKHRVCICGDFKQGGA